MKTYLASRGAMTGTTGFTNYTGSLPEDRSRVMAEVWRDHPGAVVVNGNDDWYAKVEHRPATFIGQFKEIRPLAYYHSGISGIAKTGIVVAGSDFPKLEAAYREKYGVEIDKHNRVYKQG